MNRNYNISSTHMLLIYFLAPYEGDDLESVKLGDIMSKVWEKLGFKHKLVKHALNAISRSFRNVKARFGSYEITFRSNLLSCFKRVWNCCS